MKMQWPLVRFGEVLRRSNSTVDIQPKATYRQITVKLWGKGVVQRGIVSGDEIAASRRFVARAGQFVLSRIDARNGAIGMVPPDLDGAVVSNDFPLFDVNPERIDPAFLAWLGKTQVLVRLCARASEGTTNRVRLQEDRFLALEIPLPPLAEQRRVVARIQEVAMQITEGRTLRQQAADQAERVAPNQAERVFSKLGTRYSPRAFGSFSPHVTSGPRNWAKHYEQGGFRFYRAQDIGSKGKVLDDSKAFITPPSGEQGRSAMLQRGDLMLLITGATVGRASVYREGLEPGFVSQHVAICRLPKDEVEPEFALWGLRSPIGQSQLLGQRYGQGKPGLNLSNIRSLSLSFPMLPEQRKIVAELNALEAELNALSRLQAATAAELDALLPAVLSRAFAGEL